MRVEDCWFFPKLIWEGFKVLAPLAFAGCLVYYASVQRRYAAMQIRIAMLKPRLEVHDAIRKLVAYVLQDARVDFSLLTDLLKTTKHAEFWFPENSEIRLLLDEMYNKGLELEYAVKAHKAGPRPATADHQKELVLWFRNQDSRIHQLFRPYLVIED